MIPKYRLPAAVVAVLILIGAVLSVRMGCASKAVQKHEQKAQELKGSADGHTVEAGKAAAEAAEQAKRVEASEAESARLRRELARLRRTAPVTAPASPVVDGLPMAPRAVPDYRDAIIAKQDEVIGSQARTIGELKTELKIAYTGWDHSKAAFADERKRSTELELALLAQKAASKGEYWRGFYRGLLVGVGSGAASTAYLGRR